jgi:DNA-binding NarL/FixJ family response regulator
VIAQFRDDEVLIRLNELNWQQDVSQLQNGLNTTRREAEVNSYGKLNSDMSDFLAISPRTVQKHFERI